MKINRDWHIHTESSCDSACLKTEDLVIEAEQLGLYDYGISDHVHTSVNFPDIVNSKKNYDNCIAKNPDLIGSFHFGVEVSCVSEWELDKICKGNCTEEPIYGLRDGGPRNAKPAIAVDREYIEKMGIEYVIGGVHWPLYCEVDKNSLIKDYHRQAMFLAEHKNVNIFAHYLWWNSYTYAGKKNPFADFGDIPASMKQELAIALKENNCAFEVNLQTMLLSPDLTDKFKHEYLEYVAEIQSKGVMLSIGSDCHKLHLTEVDFEISSQMIESVGIDLSKNMFTVSS